MQSVDPDRLLEAHRAYADLGGAFADLRTQESAQAALALTIASSLALDVAVRLTRASPPALEDTLRAAAEGGLRIGAPASEAKRPETKPSTDDGTIDSTELARSLGLHIETLRAMSRSGKIPARKMGREYRYYWPAICEWLSGEYAETPANGDAAPARSELSRSAMLRRLRSDLRHQRREVAPLGRRSSTYTTNRPHESALTVPGILERPKSTRLAMERLTEEACANVTRNGLHSDGGGLCLQVRGNARSWVLRFTMPGRKGHTERYLGLGRFPDVGLVEARQRAAEARELIAQGVNPIERRRAEEERQRKANECNERERKTATDHVM